MISAHYSSSLVRAPFCSLLLLFVGGISSAKVKRWAERTVSASENSLLLLNHICSGSVWTNCLLFLFFWEGGCFFVLAKEFNLPPKKDFPVTTIVYLSGCPSVTRKGELLIYTAVLRSVQMQSYLVTTKGHMTEHLNFRPGTIWTSPHVALVGPRMCPPELITLLDHGSASSRSRISEWKSLQELDGCC